MLIQSKFADITIESVSKHGFEDVLTLHAAVALPSNRDITGTEFILSGLTRDDVDRAKDFFLIYSGDVALKVRVTARCSSEVAAGRGEPFVGSSRTGDGRVEWTPSRARRSRSRRACLGGTAGMGGVLVRCSRLLTFKSVPAAESTEPQALRNEHRDVAGAREEQTAECRAEAGRNPYRRRSRSTS